MSSSPQHKKQTNNTVLLYVAAHGGVEDKDKMTLRDSRPDYGGVTVQVYSPIGTDFEPGLSGQVADSGWTNFTLTPSLLCDIVKPIKEDFLSTDDSIHEEFFQVQEKLPKLNKLAYVSYKDGGGVITNPIEQRNYHIMPAKDERYTRYDELDDKTGHRSNPGRLAHPGDVVSFNYGVFIVDTTCQDPDVTSFSIKNNVSKFDCTYREDKRKGVNERLLQLLRDNRLMNCIIDPFEDPATPEVRKAFKSCDLFKRGNYKSITALITKNCKDYELIEDARRVLGNAVKSDHKEITLEGIITVLRAIIPNLTTVKIVDHSCRELVKMNMSPAVFTPPPLDVPDTPVRIHDNDWDEDEDDNHSRSSSPSPSPAPSPGLSLWSKFTNTIHNPFTSNTKTSGGSRKKTQKRRRKTSNKKHKRKYAKTKQRKTRK